MKWFRLRSWAYPVLHLLGLGGIALTLTYVKFSDRATVSEPTKEVWLGFGIELVMVWVGVTAIDSIISARRRATETRNDLRGFLNFVGSILRDLPPHYDHWRIAQLADEVRWADDRVIPVASKFLTSAERDEARNLISTARSVLDDSQRILLTRQSVRDLDIALDQVLDEQHGSDSIEPIYRHSWPAMRDIERLYRRGVDDLELTKSEADDLAARLEAAKATIPSKWPDNVASVVRDYVDAMRTTLLSRAAVEPRISEYRDAARRLESPLSPV